MDKKIDLKSSTIEKGLEIAKEFIEKLIMPSIEETGLLFKDHLTMWRFKNQVKMLNRANEYCIKHNINPKKISLKLLCPLLEYSSLEDDDDLQDKWSILISNLIDSEQNIENNIFPYILSQLSKDEFFSLEKVYNNKVSRFFKQNLELENYFAEKENNELKIKHEIQSVEQLIIKLEKEKNWTDEIFELYSKISALENDFQKLKSKEYEIRLERDRTEIVPYNLLREFEFSNLIRLGLIKEVKEFYAKKQTLEIPNEMNYERSYTNVDLEIDVDSKTEYILTELGELFHKSCQEKK